MLLLLLLVIRDGVDDPVDLVEGVHLSAEGGRLQLSQNHLQPEHFQFANLVIFSGNGGGDGLQSFDHRRHGVVPRLGLCGAE